MKEALPQVSKYQAINIYFPDYTYHPQEILTGFYNFCDEHAFTSKIISNIHKEAIRKREVYINLMKDDLVVLIEKFYRSN